MKILVIPDVHLKPFMFRQAAQLMNRKAADLAVCLMDIADARMTELENEHDSDSCA